jgi:light-regulated signal transduction histidine kinase (bacteriophytochrome)
VNQTWNRWLSDSELAHEGLRPGGDFLAVCDEALHCTAVPVSTVLREVIDGSRVSFDGECRCGAETQSRWLRLTFAPVPGAEAASDDVILMHIDVSDRKRADEVLLQQAAELTQMNAELQQFAYIASHDLREPLRTVKSFSQLFVRRYRDQLGPEADQYLSYISDGVSRMEELIHDLLTYSKVAHGEQTAREKVDLGAVLDAVVRSLNAVIGETGARITSPELPVVNGNRTQLMQLLQNLIGNAIKYRRDVPPRVHVSAEPVDHGWRISVADNGVGIPPQYRESVFGLFKRLHSRNVPGTGIGLALCRKIAEQHGGRISVDSEVGKGSTFHVFIADARSAQTGA